VTDLRVLAVRADAPYAAPGQGVHLDALALDPAGRAISWGWGLCVNPASGSAPGCLAALDASTVVIGKDMPSFDFALPDDVIGVPGRSRGRERRRPFPLRRPQRSHSRHR
jgi:hypothetical protein